MIIIYVEAGQPLQIGCEYDVRASVKAARNKWRGMSGMMGDKGCSHMRASIVFSKPVCG